jgi:drug/metabolite transporter (DMT)-like permease
MTTQTPVPARADLSANLICMASMMIWAAGLPAADLLIPHVPPIPLAAMRTGLAAAVLIPLWWAVEGGGAVRSAPWARGTLVGGICLGAAAMFLVFAQGQTNVTTVAVISATAPVVGLALEAVAEGRRITARLALGAGLSLLGAGIALGPGVANLSFGLGAAAAFASVCCYTWGSWATVSAFRGLTPLGRAGITCGGAAIASAGVAAVWTLAGGAGPDWAELGPAEWAALAMFGIGAIAVSQLLWIVSVGRLGIAVASLHTNAAPFYVMAILAALGQAWSPRQAAGAGVVVLGVLVAQGILGGRLWKR